MQQVPCKIAWERAPLAGLHDWPRPAQKRLDGEVSYGGTSSTLKVPPGRLCGLACGRGNPAARVHLRSPGCSWGNCHQWLTVRELKNRWCLHANGGMKRLMYAVLSMRPLQFHIHEVKNKLLNKLPFCSVVWFSCCISILT